MYAYSAGITCGYQTQIAEFWYWYGTSHGELNDAIQDTTLGHAVHPILTNHMVNSL